MKRIVLDPPTLSKLGRLDRMVELYDQDGRMLGFFCPTDRSQYEGVEPPISDDELREREDEVGGFSTAQLLDHLRSLDSSEND